MIKLPPHAPKQCVTHHHARDCREEAIRSLLTEIMQWHSDPQLTEYNGCDKDPCHWCENAKRILDGTQRHAERIGWAEGDFMSTKTDPRPSDSPPATGSAGWVSVTAQMPPMDVLVWLYEPSRGMFIGARCDTDDGWLWGNSYGNIWHNGVKWDGDTETDDDYKPSHWMRLPTPPSEAPSEQPGGKDSNGH